MVLIPNTHFKLILLSYRPPPPLVVNVFLKVSEPSVWYSSPGGETIGGGVSLGTSDAAFQPSTHLSSQSKRHQHLRAQFFTEDVSETFDVPLGLRRTFLTLISNLEMSLPRHPPTLRSKFV